MPLYRPRTPEPPAATPPPAYTGPGQFGAPEGYEYRFDTPQQRDIEGLLATYIKSPINMGPLGAGGTGGGGGGGGGVSQGDAMMNTNPITSRDIGSGGSAGLANYASGRDYQAATDYFRNYAESVDPDRYYQELQEYAKGVDPYAAVNPLMEFLKNFDPTGGMTPYFEQRLSQLQASPFDDRELAARREGAFADMEEDRNIQKRRLIEDMAGRGHAESSGAVTEALANLDRNFDRQRAEAQNSLVQQEFEMRRQNLAQADQLQLSRGQLNMQGQQLAGTLTGQVGELMQQGLGLQNSLRVALGQMGLEEQSQQTEIIGTVSQLMASGMQMQDAVYQAIAQNQTAEQGNRAGYYGALAGAEANVYGSRLSYLGQLAQARASSGASRAANELGWAEFAETQRRNRLGAGLDLPSLGPKPEDFGQGP